MQVFFEDIKKLYTSLNDEKSKKNFIYRVLAGIEENYEHIAQMIKDNCRQTDAYTIGDWYTDKDRDKKKIIIYGAGWAGYWRVDANNYLGVDFYAFCDSDEKKIGTEFLGKRIISPKELIEEHKDAYVLIETYSNNEEIYNFLISNGFPKEQIMEHSDYGIQYFNYDQMKFGEHEVMVDGGCYDCGTIKDFIKKVNGKYDKIIAFEPDQNNYNNCMRIVEEEGLRNVKIVNAGMSDKNEELLFSGDVGVFSRFLTEGEETNEHCKKVSTRTIDDVCKDENVTFIKMDLEGWEYQALNGAKETIQRCKPKLAISIYHKWEDVIDCYSYIMQLVPEYKFAIRHCSEYMWETVLYAWMED